MAASSARFRPAVRGLVAVMTAGLLAALLAVPTGAEQNGISLAVSLGYRDIVRAGQWMPVTVEATNKGSDFLGSLQVEQQFAANFFGKGPAGAISQQATVTSQVPLALAAGATKHLRLYLLIDNPGASVVARAIRDGRAVVSQTATPAATAGTLVGVLSDQPSALEDLGAVRINPNLPSPQVVHLKREDLPDSAILMRAFDILAIDDFATDSLTGAQRAALADYVAEGGNLLLGTGPAWRKTLAGIPATLLPAQPEGTVMLSQTGLSGLSGLEIATVGAVTGRAWLQAGQRPLLLERTVGTGLVTQATFDWAQDPIASWGGTRGVLRQVAVRSLMRSQQGAAGGFPIGIGGGAPFPAGYGQSGSVTQRGNTLLAPLQNLPALELPSLKLTGLLVALYILLVGPANYMVLRLLGRRELAWLTVPVIAVVFAAGAYGLGVGTKGRAVQSNQISIMHLLSGVSNAYRETYTGIFAPARGDYSVAVPDRAMIAPLSAGYGPQGPLPGSIRVHVDQGTVDLLGVTAYTLRGFATESMVPAPAITANVRIAGGKLTGRIENRSALRLSDAVVVAGDAFQSLGAVAPGASADINLEPTSTFMLGGQPAIMRLYQGNPQPGQSSAAIRESNQRSQILQLLLGAFKGGPTTSAPMLIAWTHDPLETITVSGHRPAIHAQNAIVLPLAVDQVVTGPIPNGLFTARLVDSTGEVNLNPTGSYIRSGSATFEFYAPLAVGQRLLGAGIASRNIYLGKSVTPGQSGFESQVWDWTRGAWVPVTLKEGESAALPAGSVNSDGTIRLRVRETAGLAFQVGTLSLSGEIQ